jgi:hypothetical protein
MTASAHGRVHEDAIRCGCEQRHHFVAEHGGVFERVGHLQLPDWWVEREVEVRST